MRHSHLLLALFIGAVAIRQRAVLAEDLVNRGCLQASVARLRDIERRRCQPLGVEGLARAGHALMPQSVLQSRLKDRAQVPSHPAAGCDDFRDQVRRQLTDDFP